MSRPLLVTPGRPWPLGAHPREDGFDFAVVSRHATRVWLDLFLDSEAASPSHEIALQPDAHRTGDVWHVHVGGVPPGAGYAFRAEGPWAPDAGHRFDPSARLYDPYAYALRTPWWTSDAADRDGGAPRWHEAVCLTVGGAASPAAPRSERPRRPWSETLLYEMHVRGFTAHPTSGVAHPGTFLGVVEKIPYLRELGVTAVELLPIHEFNPRELERRRPDGAALRNYWGYSPVALFAPTEGYGTRRAPGCQVDELRTMVEALHRAGIEVVLDVVFNHTAESHERGPTLSFRGLANDSYYLLDADRRRYLDLTGCGNTVACQHPLVQDLIVDCLRHWAIDLGVDGFRFDLAAVLARGGHGELLDKAPLLERIAEDPLLRDVKLIAEPWDAAGGHRLGAFPPPWSEWNDRYRDDVRRFWRGDPGFAGSLATRICGSADLYQGNGGTPARSINFVTCHDGFTLADLVSYSRKHNLANGEGGRDGAGHDFSAHYGVEGPSDDPAICTVRLRQQKNLIATLLVSRGVPMLLGGDELGRTQLGNNNAYCHDNEISWYDWSLLERNRELFRFVREMIAFRRRHPMLSRDEFYELGEVHWLSRQGQPRNWANPTSTLAAHVRSHRAGDGELCLLFNASPETVVFRTPAIEAAHWRVVVDTAAPSPGDVAPLERARRLADERECPVRDRTLVVLEATRG
jgi:glycogen operon protein